MQLSNADVSAIVRATSVLLDPFSYEDGDSWQRAVCDSLRQRIEEAAQSLEHTTSGAGLKSSNSDSPVKANFEAHTTTGHYRISAVYLPTTWAGSRSRAVVFVESLSRRCLSDKELHACFALTRREIQVARLIKQGLSSRQIGDALGISMHTARRHAERVLEKLNVHSRSAVGLKI